MKYGRREERLYTLQDATIACAFAMLAATALGLGAETPQLKSRRSLDDLVHHI